MLLEKRGRFAVDVAVNGQIAVDVVKASMMVDPEIGEGEKKQYDFICMDFTMPIMVGTIILIQCKIQNNRLSLYSFTIITYHYHIITSLSTIITCHHHLITFTLRTVTLRQNTFENSDILNWSLVSVEMLSMTMWKDSIVQGQIVLLQSLSVLLR